MIPAEELRLGNIVHRFGELHEVEREDFETWTFEEMEPVKLTKDHIQIAILDAFNDDPEKDFALERLVIKEVDDGFVAYIWSGEGGPGMYISYGFNTPIKYYHQLQNYIFALSGKELDIDTNKLIL